MLTYLLIIIGIYALVVSGAYFLQERFIFHPEKLHEQFKFSFKNKFRGIKLNTSDTDFIDGLLFQANQKKGIIFYFKGNTRIIKGCSKFSLDFITLGYDAFMIDYPRFGKSVGSKSETNICNDCKVAYDWLKAHYDENNIIIYGRSFGTGIATKAAASYVAGCRKPRKVMLETPFYSMVDLFYTYYKLFPLLFRFKYSFKNHEYLKRAHCSIHIIAAGKDLVVPKKSSSKLQRILKDTDEFIVVEQGQHNDLAMYDIFQEFLDRTLR